MITAFLFLSSFIQFYWLYRLLKKSDEHNARLTTLERRESDRRKPETFGKTEQVQDKQLEQPKAGTVAAKAVKPVVYLAHVPHTAIQLDNGGLEWEGKI